MTDRFPAPSSQFRSRKKNNVCRIGNVEQLEARALLASIAVDVTGELVVTGNSGLANTINVSLSADGKTVSASAAGVSRSYAVASLRSLKILGGSSNDAITVGSTVKLTSWIFPGNGNDTINTGGGADHIYETSGANRATLGDGNDLYEGGNGNDTVYGGNGNDSMLGRGGVDLFWGEAGDDNFDGGDAINTFNGGTGIDTGKNANTMIAVENTGSVVPTPTPTPTPPTPSPTPTSTTGGPVGGGIGAAAGGTIFAPALADAAAVKPVAVISARQSSIKAGSGVFVNALSSTLNAGTTTTARYEWDFGDGSGKYNKLVGFTAGHVYANPGTYTITLRVLNEKRGQAVATKVITVQAAGRRQIFVSSAGSDSNDGSSARPIKSIAKAAALIAKNNNVELLLRRGDTFNQATTLSIGGTNVKIGAYGSGNDPILNWNGAKTSQMMIRIEGGSTGAIVEDITFDSIWVGPSADRSGLPFAIKVDGNDSVVRGSTFLNVSYGFQTNAKPTGLIVQDNDAPSAFALRSYFLWGEGNDFVILGNRVTNVIHEHAIRIFGVNRILIAYNDLANPKTYSFEPAKNALNLQWADYAYVYGNTLHGNNQLGPLGGTEGLTWRSATLRHLVFESNHGVDCTIRIVPGLIDSVLRNNVIQKTNDNAIIVDPADPTYPRIVSNVSFVNNTVVNPGTQGKFLYLGGKASGLVVANNLYKADNLIVGEHVTAGLYVNDTSLASFSFIGGNVWPIPTIPVWAAGRIPGGTGINGVSLDANAVGNYYNISRWNALGVVGSDAQQDTAVNSTFVPAASATAANFALHYGGVFSDYTGKVRSLSGSWSVGAMQV